MKSIEQALSFRDEGDLNVLHDYMRFELRAKPGAIDALLRALLASMLHDKKWIFAAKASLASELSRVASVGEAMRRAGLRSYTDKDGCIFVADDR